MKEFEQASRVEFIGIHDFDEIEKAQALRAAENSLGKMQRITKHETRLVVHVKTHEADKEGKGKKFSIHSKLFWAGKFLEASHVEWGLLPALLKSLSVLEKEVIKKLKR